MASIQRDFNFFVVPDALIDSELTPYAKTVYVVLARHADKSGSCFPAYKRIQKLGGCGKMSVVQAIKDLQAAGWLEYQRTGRSNAYILMSAPRTSEVRPADNRSPPSGHEGQPNEGQPNEGQEPAAPALVKSPEMKRAELEKGFEAAAAASNLQRMILLGLELVNEQEFSNYPREQKAAGRLAEKIKRISNGQEPRAFLRALVAAYKHKKETSKAEYWKDAPMTPSALDTRFDDVMEHLRKRTADHQAGQENRELLARLKL
jgi:hypothetical protein